MEPSAKSIVVNTVFRFFIRVISSHCFSFPFTEGFRNACCTVLIFIAVLIQTAKTPVLCGSAPDTTPYKSATGRGLWDPHQQKSESRSCENFRAYRRGSA